VLLVDEVGPMELLSERFVRSVERVIGSVRASAFTVHYKASNGAMTKVTPVPFAPTRISVKDFGPIREADVHLGKATVLMGPNNTGKTYFTLLMPVLEQLAREWRFAQDIISPPKYTLEDFIQYHLAKAFDDVACRLYSVDRPEELIRRGSEKAELRFELRPEVENSNTLELEIQIKKTGAINPRFHGFRELFEANIVPEIKPVVYIPAERAGLMRTFRQLLRFYVATSYLGAPRHERKIIQLISDRIRLPGVSRLFFDTLLDMEKFTQKEREKAYVAPALKLLEEEVLGGRLEMGRDFSVTFYEAGVEKPIDLINTSAMVSELSALYLLSGTLKKDWWLVVEEPGAHVHPKGQATIARYFAKLARLGVNVMATTHSDVIILKLAQMVGLASLSSEERERLGYRGDEYLTKEELALYSFEPTGDGSIARKIEVSETGEVSELPTYSNVVEEMYGEAVRLLELHGKIPKVSEG
jgi:predicted ATPase